MYIKYRTYDGWGTNHLDHNPHDLKANLEPSTHINPWESTMLVPTLEAFEAASKSISWSVVQMDNYGRETEPDRLMSVGHSIEESHKICEFLNESVDSKGSIYFATKSSHSRLSLGMIDHM